MQSVLVLCYIRYFLNLLLYGVLTGRRWVIKMIAGKCANLPEIVERESELVKKIVEVLFCSMIVKPYIYNC